MNTMFGDRRLDARLEQLTDQLSTMPTGKLTQCLFDWANLKAAYRFVNNPKVSHEGIIQIEQQATLKRLEWDVGEIVLAVQDTTSFNFSGRPALSGLGVLENNVTPGFFAHTTLAVSEEGIPMGVLEQEVWSRPQNLGPDKEAHKARPITEKESYKWLQGLRGLPDTTKRFVTVCDREADIYEMFQDANDRQMDFIVRASHNRRLEDAPLLREHMGTICAAGHYTVKVQRQVDQDEREARVSIRYTTVTLTPPKRPKSARVMPLEPQTVQAVEVWEPHPPSDVKEPVHWILLTSLPVTCLDEAYRIVRFYTYRWLVERFHFVLKSGGCGFEDSQLRTVEALHRLLGLCSRVAWRLLWLTYHARQTPDAPCTAALTEAEWQALTAFNRQSPLPAPSPPTLMEAVRAIAKLGGFIGRKSDGAPGVKTLWRGWRRLQDIVAAWIIFHPT